MKMGTDIHTFVEVKRNGKWESADLWSGDQVDYDAQIYWGRNYNLFSILANVRNENSLRYISLPRGLPSDLSEQVNKRASEDFKYSHDHSYLTLKELLEFDWNKKAFDCGYLSKEEYKKWDGLTEPDDYCKGIGGNVKVVSANKIKNAPSGDGTIYYTIAKWQQTYADFAEHFYYETIPELKKMGSAENVRIVFYFDS